MGYTASGGPKGLGVFNTTPQTAADFNKILELLALTGNFYGGVTEAERDDISGDQLYAGLMVFNTDTSTLDLYDGSGWVVVASTPATTATPCTAATGWSITAQTAVRQGLWALVNITVERTGAAITVPSSGNIVNTQVATFNAGWVPLAGYSAVLTAEGLVVVGFASDNSITITHAAPGQTIPTGTIFSLQVMYPVA